MLGIHNLMWAVQEPPEWIVKATERVRIPDGFVKSTIPVQDIGGLRVERFTVSLHEAARFNMRHEYERYLAPGTYTRLVEGGTVWMSDTPAECRDHAELVHQAAGRVLVHGLGLGVCVEAMLLKPRVTEVEVWELDENVIALVAPTLQERYGARLKIVRGDAMEHRPRKGERWNVVWHDIWPTISADNLKPMQQLCARFRTRCSWQDCWARPTCRKLARAERGRQRYW